MENGSVIITADTGCDIEWFNGLTIPTSSISSYIIDEKGLQYKDRIEITNKEIYIRTSKGETFKTSAPNYQDFKIFFESLLEKYDKIIHVSISREVSYGAFNTSCKVASQLNDIYGKRIFVVDSKLASCGTKLAIFLLIKSLEENNRNIIEAIKVLKEKYIPNIEAHFLVTDAIGFIKSGRNKSSSQIWKVGTVKTLKKLGIKFEVTIKNGKFIQSGIKRYSKKDMFEDFVKNKIQKIGLDNISKDAVIFGTTYSQNDDFTTKAFEYLNSLNYFNYIQRQDMSSVVGTFVAEDSCFIAFFKKV